jgi:hypothetical protein
MSVQISVTSFLFSSFSTLLSSEKKNSARAWTNIFTYSMNKSLGIDIRLYFFYSNLSFYFFLSQVILWFIQMLSSIWRVQKNFQIKNTNIVSREKIISLAIQIDSNWIFIAYYQWRHLCLWVSLCLKQLSQRVLRYNKFCDKVKIFSKLVCDMRHIFCCLC